MGGWSGRLKRHGGAQVIRDKRAVQMVLLGQCDPEDLVVKGSYIFLTDNPNRVLGAEVMAHLKGLLKKAASKKAEGHGKEVSSE